MGVSLELNPGYGVRDRSSSLLSVGTIAFLLAHSNGEVNGLFLAFLATFPKGKL